MNEPEDNLRWLKRQAVRLKISRFRLCELWNSRHPTDRLEFSRFASYLEQARDPHRLERRTGTAFAPKLLRVAADAAEAFAQDLVDFAVEARTRANRS